MKNCLVRNKEICYNNIYMFKNPVRHFLNIGSVNYGCKIELEKLTHTIPIKFNIRKYYGKDDIRVIRLPNILNFHNLFLRTYKMSNFYDISNISHYYSKMKINLRTGDFKTYNYQENVELDLQKLCIYDKVVKLDINSFYNSLYTHKLVKYTEFISEDRFITNMKNGETDGILMGNYISIYLAEHVLSQIAISLKQKMKENNIENELKYFSDDFYIFCYNEDIEEVKSIFYKVLSDYDLSANSSKTEILDYTEYNEQNLLNRYWKTIIRNQKEHERIIDQIKKESKNDKSYLYYLNFLNQLIYRKSKLNSAKNKAILINGFFRTNYFINLNPSEYLFNINTIHQILHLYSEHPEIMLYSIDKFCKNKFFKQTTKEYFKKKLIHSLKKNYHEEQLYLYYASKFVLDNDFFTDSQIIELVIKSENQILQSYFILYENIDDKYIDKMLIENEYNWFTNYHIIHKKAIAGQNVDDLIKTFLVPTKCYENEKLLTLDRRSTYFNFYKSILNNNTLISDIPYVKRKINYYLELKKEERQKITPKTNYPDI